ncbi:UDP-N-acetyl-D-mannosamine dehydrogenase [Terasakiella sp.]|uniref:UDP-N-acetyl-D-mannosamine dehydrogenase n=1 Tax=Terasakiella sp. TaxID=2034861 RepID=UPI003AA864DC
MNFKKICVVGLGYIGLPTAATFASRDVEVIGVDVNEDVIACINNGEAHIVEPDLDYIVQGTVASGKLKAYHAPQKAEAFIIAVPTPLRDGRYPDIGMVKEATASIAPVLEKGNLVILESTSPVGTTEIIQDILKEARPDLTFPCDAGDDSDISIAYCPERILPGRLLIELVENDRIIGGLSAHSAKLACDLYGAFVVGKMLRTTAPTAEMVKLSENTYRDVNIALANELALVCREKGIDPWEMIKLANHHPRVNILSPGPGVGGHCIAVDPWFVVDSAPEIAKLVKTARLVNEARPGQVVAEIQQMAEEFKHPKIACLGLAYKPNIDDIRESPAVDIVKELAEKASGEAQLLVVEPYLEKLPKQLDKENIKLVSMETALNDAHIVVLLVDHNVFVDLSLKDLKNKVILDTRGVWN